MLIDIISFKMNIDSLLRDTLSVQTYKSIIHDLARVKARKNFSAGIRVPDSKFLHLGCGQRRVPRWLNVDISNSDFDLDLAANIQFPWPPQYFQKVVSQHVIEHLEISTELLPLLKNLRKVCGDDCQLWFSCPDIRKICESYLSDKCQGLYEGRKKRFPGFSLGNLPVQHLINDLFVQRGEHKNLFDLDLLKWLFYNAGFSSVTETCEYQFLLSNPEFPARNDGEVSIYVIVLP